MDNRYREELDRIRLTEESKGALICALTERREAPEGRRRRVPLRRLAALAACAALVLGLMNYPAIAAGAERVFRYILGVGAAETSASLLVQGEALSHEDGDFLDLIDGAYQRDGVLTVPLDVVSREESPDREAAMRYRITVYDAEGERLPQVYRWDGELREFRGAETVRFQPLDAYSNWLAWTWLPQGYAGAASNCFLMGTEGSAGGPYTFDVDLYITGRGWQRTVWKGGTLELDTPQAVEVTEASRTFAEGTVHRPGGGRRAQRVLLRGAAPPAGRPGGGTHPAGHPCGVVCGRGGQPLGERSARLARVGGILAGVPAGGADGGGDRSHRGERSILQHRPYRPAPGQPPASIYAGLQRPGLGH